MTVRVSEAVRLRWTDETGKTTARQVVLSSLVGMKVSKAVEAIETFGYLGIAQPMAVNGERTHLRAARILRKGDVLTVDP